MEAEGQSGGREKALFLHNLTLKKSMARTHPFANLKKKTTKPQDIERKVMRVLEEARCEPRFRAAKERDALITSIRYGHTNIAESLLAHGVDSNGVDAKGRNALWYASQGQWKGELVRKLVKRGTNLPDDVLMGPVDDGDEKTVKYLIQHGANVNCVATFTRYSYKFPAKQVLLTMAIEGVASEDAPETIPAMLIKGGADMNRLAFTYSLHDGFIRTILGLAAHHGLLKSVRAMLAAGANANIRDSWGGTPLIDAAHKGHRPVVRALLKAGAKLDIKRKDGRTAISIAREHGFASLADELERRAALA